ncbi:MAG TPA: hypothetical protein ENK23_05700 [Sorangium sp.]|nr:hypothetical protein [Sorangium sp.]
MKASPRDDAPCTRRAIRYAVMLAGALLVCGCATVPPRGWRQGGAHLIIPRARWVYGAISIELTHRGLVTLAGAPWLTIDGAGRVSTPDGEPVALLLGDGMLRGPNDRRLGWVGAGESIKPGELKRWLVFQPSGEVLKNDGTKLRPFGVWFGCNQRPDTLQACTLVTHLLAQSWWKRQTSTSNRPFGSRPFGSRSTSPTFITPFP